MADARRLMALSMVPELAKEVATQIDGAGGGLTVPAAAQPDSTATTIAGLVVDFNALLAKLRTAGVIAP